LGFHYEHSRPDRDLYIRIDWRNIKTTKWHLFQKLSKDQFIYDVDAEGFDILSVMHPNISNFAINPDAPIMYSKTSKEILKSQKPGLSEGDIKKIVSAYSCIDIQPRQISISGVAGGSLSPISFSFYWIVTLIHFISPRHCFKF